MITLEQYEQIRRMYHEEEQSERAIARRLGISRRTVSKAVHAEQPPAYTLKQPRSAPRLGAYKAHLDTLLAENSHLPKKQRYTAHKLFELIQAEGYQGSEASVQAYGVQWHKAHKRPATFLPLAFEPGQDAQVDWGEAQVILAGIQQTVHVFVMHLSRLSAHLRDVLSCAEARSLSLRACVCVCLFWRRAAPDQLRQSGCCGQAID